MALLSVARLVDDIPGWPYISGRMPVWQRLEMVQTVWTAKLTVYRHHA
ncbi:MAG: hypothetical protein ACJ746_06445 [Bryobacteraceae bacterium]